jgi:hypothetical protein
MKAGFTLGSAMSSARSFSVRVMRQQLNDRTQSCRGLAGKTKRALGNTRFYTQRPPPNLTMQT